MSDLAAVPLLLVEDNEQEALLLRQALEELNVPNPLVRVKNGREAIAYLTRDGTHTNHTEFPQASVVVLDSQMPADEGFELLRRIRQTPALRHLLVAVLARDAADVAKAYRLGADSYLGKPASSANVEEWLTLLSKHWPMLERIVEFRREMAQPETTP